jgi:hypothetical protein
MSPGARTIPAAMVLPTAAEMPNHIPRIFRRRPRLLGAARASKVLLDAEALDVEALDVEDSSGGFGNGWFSGTFGNLAIIMAVRENASRKWPMPSETSPGETTPSHRANAQ